MTRISSYGDFSILEAISLARAGELVARTLDEESDQLAIGALFRAIAAHAEVAGRRMEACAVELRELKGIKLPEVQR